MMWYSSKRKDVESNISTLFNNVKFAKNLTYPECFSESFSTNDSDEELYTIILTYVAHRFLKDDVIESISVDVEYINDEKETWKASYSYGGKVNEPFDISKLQMEHNNKFKDD